MTSEFKLDARGDQTAVTWHGDDLAKAVESQRANALYAGARLVVSAARPPRRTGRLAKSGYAKAAGGRSSYRGGKGRRKPPRLKRGTALAAFSQFYGGFQESGTRRHRAQPYLGPALAANRNRAAKAISDSMGKAIGAK